MEADYTIWADGSFRDQDSPAGAGWVIEDAAGRLIAEESLPIPQGTVMSSTEAEVYAATKALECLETNASVRFYGDNEGVLGTLRRGSMPLEYMQDKRQFALYSALILARGRLRARFSYASSRNKPGVEKTPQMERAHDLAQKGWQAALRYN